MNASDLLPELLLRVAAEPLLLAAAIIAATFVLEDLATVTVALLASHMAIDGSVALIAAIVGTALGDVALYIAARWAGHRPWIRRRLASAAAANALTWLRRHALAMVILARFVPGLRLPVFAGAGAIGMTPLTFTLAVILTSLIWTPGLYLAARQFGTPDLAWSGAILAATAAILLCAPHAVARLLARMRA